MWQSDFTHVPYAERSDAEVLSFLDDHSRHALSITAHNPVTGPAVLTAFRNAVAEHGIPVALLTDNGTVFTARFVGGRNALETELARLGVKKKNSRPAHPQTCGKVERFQQTLKRWLTQQPRPATVAELQTLLDAFKDEYNNRRPHRSLDRRTPAAAYLARPKATPTDDPGQHERIRHDRVDHSGKVTIRHHGRLHHIGLGREHAGAKILLLVQDLQIRIAHASTGELIRELTLDPSRDYQPTGKPRNRRTPRT